VNRFVPIVIAGEPGKLEARRLVVGDEKCIADIDVEIAYVATVLGAQGA
jgi:hypothetical protein